MSLAGAALALLTLPNGHGVRACRPRCAEHAAHVAHAIEGAALEHGLDPWLLLAQAFHESSLLGRANATSAGFWGWHRRRSVLWRACAAPCGVEEQASVTAAELVRLVATCGGVEGALSAWQSGVCASTSGRRYARRVLRLRERLEREHLDTRTAGEWSLCVDRRALSGPRVRGMFSAPARASSLTCGGDS